MVNRGLRRFGGDVSNLVQRALANLPRGTDGHSHAVGDPTRLRQFPVRLSRTQYYLYGRLGIPRLSQIVSASLRELLGG